MSAYSRSEPRGYIKSQYLLFQLAGYRPVRLLLRFPPDARLLHVAVDRAESAVSVLIPFLIRADFVLPAALSVFFRQPLLKAGQGNTR